MNKKNKVIVMIMAGFMLLSTVASAVAMMM